MLSSPIWFEFINRFPPFFRQPKSLSLESSAASAHCDFEMEPECIFLKGCILSIYMYTRLNYVDAPSILRCICIHVAQSSKARPISHASSLKTLTCQGHLIHSCILRAVNSNWGKWIEGTRLKARLMLYFSELSVKVYFVFLYVFSLHFVHWWSWALSLKASRDNAIVHDGLKI